MDLLTARLVGHDISEEATNSAEVRRSAVLPSTSLVLVLKPAYSESVP